MKQEQPKEIKTEKQQKDAKSEIENNLFVRRTTQVLGMAEAAIKLMENAASKMKIAINLIQ